MSKGFSGLFKNTSGHKITTKAIRDRAFDKVKKLINRSPNGKKKSMAVGAYDIKNGRVVAAFAGPIPSKIHPELVKRAKAIGGIGTHGLSTKNTVGVCAEFHVVNKLLFAGSRWEDIRLTPSIRPRTGKVQPYCENCMAMFYDIIR